MAQIKFEKEKLDALLVEVGNELAEMVKAESELAKSATDDAPAEESEGTGAPTEPDGDVDGDDAAPAPEASAPGMDDGSAPAPEASAPEMGGGPEASAPGMDQQQAIEPAPTVEELQAEYAKLDPEGLKMHYLACKSALMMLMGADQGDAGAGPEASAPGAAPMAPPAAAPPPSPEASAPMAPAMKGELKAKDAQLGDMNTIGGEVKEGGTMKVAKSEMSSEVALMKAQLDEMQKQNQALLHLVEVATKPIRKSIKGMSDLKFIERTEEAKVAPAAKMTKSEVTQKLRDKVREGNLSKSDKALVSQYSVGAIDITKIEHLLADAK